MTPEKEIERGLHADQLLDHYLFKESFTTVRQNIMDSWASSPIRDKEGAHELRLMLHCLTNIENYIRSIAETGKMASLQREQTLGQKIMRIAGR
jgi:hypothetical protein